MLASVSQRRTRWLALLVPMLAASVGAMIVVAPMGALAVAAAFGIAVVLAVGQRMRGAFFVLLVGLLAGYAFLGRGFAYLGVAPVYLGEVGLVMGVLAVVTILPTRHLRPVEWLIVIFMGWGVVRTVPYVSVYGLDALRDAVLWGYAAYALAIALVLTRAHVRRFVGLYARALPVFVLWVPVLSAIWFAAPAILPVAPGTDVTIPFLKFGDIAVHLAGAAAFMLAGLHRSVWRRVGEPLLWIAWLVSFAMVAVLNRGGALAITMTGLIVFYARRPGRWVAPVLVVLLLVGAVGLINPEIRTGAARRVISVNQVIENLESVFGQSDDGTLQGTRRWREQWWGEIVSYTIGGPYFWGGKGFGVNLAVEDGFESDPGLRAPHNAHVHVLARMGVIGLVLWIALQAAFLATLVRAARSASRLGRRTWVAILGWITVYWAAAMVNMSFDVYLEGPQGGIVYWSIVGFGIAAAVAVRDMEARARTESPAESGTGRKRRPIGEFSAPAG